jgi:hypothetical protein
MISIFNARLIKQIISIATQTKQLLSIHPPRDIVFLIYLKKLSAPATDALVPNWFNNCFT